MNKFQALSAFVQVVEQGSFAAASKALGITASAITKNIAGLEDELNVKLLSRTTRRIAVTEYGQQFYDRCVNILNDLEDAEMALKDASGAPSGTVRIVASHHFGRVTLVPALGQFYARYPDITLKIKLSDFPIDLIKEGYDLAVLSRDLRDSRFIRRVLVRGPMVTVASPDYVARHGGPEVPDDLVNHNCIINKHGPNWVFHRDGKRMTVKVSGNLWIESGDSYREAAVCGLGIANSTRWLFRKDLESGDLVTLLDDYPHDGVPISVIYLDKRNISKKVAAVIDYLVDITKCEGSFWDSEDVGSEPALIGPVGPPGIGENET
jgi:DNA-binding transcriptional LysR family regulator